MAAERSLSAGKRIQALLLGLVPGLAHVVVLDRAGIGTLFFVLFVAGADAALAGMFLLETSWATDAYLGGCALAGAAWLASWLDMARLAVFRDYGKREEIRKRLTSEGVRQYAAGHMLKARGSFRKCLSMNHRDVDSLFWYGCIEARLGRVRRARRAFRRCRRYDLERKWAFEVEEQERRLREGPPAADGGG